MCYCSAQIKVTYQEISITRAMHNLTFYATKSQTSYKLDKLLSFKKCAQQFSPNNYLYM